MTVDEHKAQVRAMVWAQLDSMGAGVNGSTVGKIPNFVGADNAARLLAELDIWSAAAVLKSNPDKAQRPVREEALRSGKKIYMAVPKMAGLEPFYELDPNREAGLPLAVADSDRAAGAVPTVGVSQISHLDLVVAGSVAVNSKGARLGKGRGYADLELALLSEVNAITESTIIVTTVHDAQVLDEEIPESEHDFRCDFIVTPMRVIECPRALRPRGIIAEHLTAEKIASIPVLAARWGTGSRN